MSKIDELYKKIDEQYIEIFNLKQELLDLRELEKNTKKNMNFQFDYFRVLKQLGEVESQLHKYKKLSSNPYLIDIYTEGTKVLFNGIKKAINDFALNGVVNFFEKIPMELYAISDKINFFPINPICGIYFLLEGKKIQYIGKSLNIKKRIKSHIKDSNKIFDNVLYIIVNRENLNRCESLLIDYYKPPLNKTYKSNSLYETNKVLESLQKLMLC